MITSSAPGSALDKLRRLAGPAPEGCRITDGERLHLIYQFTALAAALQGGTPLAFRAVRQTREQLMECGLSEQEIDEVYERHRFSDPVTLADAFAVHPSLQSADYLD